MNSSLLESTIIKCEIALFNSIGLASVMLSSHEILSTVGWSIIGSGLGGIVFTSFSKGLTLKQWGLRWLTNFCAGIVFGAVLSIYYRDAIQDYPLPILAMLCGFLGGPLAVIALPIGIPIFGEIIQILFNKLKKAAKKYE